jgi:O-antigen/teichoic acid export membrane protein
LPREVYGNYKFILSAVSILGALSLAGMGTAVIQAVAAGKEGVLRDAVRTSLRWGVFPWAVALVMALYYFFVENIGLGIALIIAGTCMPLINAYSLSNSLFSGRKDFKRSTVFAMSSQIGTTLLLIVTAIFIHDAVVLVAVNFISSAIFASLFYFYIIRKYQPNNVTDPDMISYGKHVSYMNFFGTLANQLDKVLVFHFLGAAELAIYAFAIAIPEQVKGSYKNLFNIALPKMSSADPSLLRASVLDKVFRLTAVTILGVAVYYFAAPYIYAIFFPKYLDAVWYSQVYMLGLATVPGIALFSSYFQVKRDTVTLYKLTVLSNIVTIFLSVVLIYSYGLAGAVVENGVSWVVMLLINVYFFVKSGRV